MNKIAVSVREAASLLSCDRSTVYRLIDQGELPSLKIGHTKVLVKDLEAYVESKKEVKNV